MRQHIWRFGQYTLDMEDKAEVTSFLHVLCTHLPFRWVSLGLEID
jgi:hypothetical protein